MPYIYVVKSVEDWNQYRSGDETSNVTRTFYSTLKSANRAAYEIAIACLEADDECGGVEDEKRALKEQYKRGGSFGADGQTTKYVWSVQVTRQKTLGPDLEKGEKDLESSDSDWDEDKEDTVEVGQQETSVQVDGSLHSHIATGSEGKRKKLSGPRKLLETKRERPAKRPKH